MAKCIGSIDKYIGILAGAVVRETGSSPPPEMKNIEDEADLDHHLMLLRKDYIMMCQITMQQNAQHKINCKDLQSNIFALLDSIERYITERSVQAFRSINSDRSIFIDFITRMSDKIECLLVGIGRLSDIHENIIQQDQIKPLMSNESICIHTNMTIWLRSIGISQLLYKRVDNSSDMDSDTILDTLSELKSSDGQLDLGPQYTAHLMEIVLIDLILSSWNSFTQLTKFRDFFKSTPFSCPCSYKLFVKILRLTLLEGQSDILVGEQSLKILLEQILEPTVKPLLTDDLTHYDFLPSNLDPDKKADSSKAYYIIWFLFNLSRSFLKDRTNHSVLLATIKKCDSLLKKCLIFYMKDFDRQNQHKRLKKDENGALFSPHNEERFKLMLIMLIHWLQNISNDISILMPLYYFFSLKWDSLASHYFNLDEITRALETLDIDDVPVIVTRMSDSSKNTSYCHEISIFELFSQLVNINIKSIKQQDIQMYLKRKLHLTFENITRYSDAGFMASIILPLSIVTRCNLSIWKEIHKFIMEILLKISSVPGNLNSKKYLLLSIRLLFLYSPDESERNSFAEKLSELILGLHNQTESTDSGSQPNHLQDSITWILACLQPPSKLFYLFPEKHRHKIIDTLKPPCSQVMPTQDLNMSL